MKEQGQVFGLNTIDLLGNYDQDSQSLRMSQLSILEDSISYLEILPKQGMMQNGNVYLQQKLELGIKETEYGLYPTPVTVQRPQAGAMSQMRKKVLKGEISRQEASQMVGKDIFKAHPPRLKEYKKQEMQKLYPTPVASDYNARRKTKNWKGNDLVSQVAEMEYKSERTAYLNPTWGEWLMGYPMGYTNVGKENQKVFQE